MKKFKKIYKDLEKSVENTINLLSNPILAIDH